MIEERRREGAVPTSRPVERRALRIAGEGDQRSARQIAVDRAQAALDHQRSGLLPRQRRRERIVAAGVEDDDVDAVLPLHFLEQERDADRVQIKVGRTFQDDVGRDEVVLLIDRDPVAGIVNDRRLGAGERGGELGDFPAHLVDVEIVAVDHLKAELAETVGDRSCVEDGVIETNGVLIGPVPDHQRDALLINRYARQRSRRREAEGDRRQNGQTRGNRKPRQDAEEFSHPPSPLASPSALIADRLDERAACAFAAAAQAHRRVSCHISGLHGDRYLNVWRLSL